MWQTISVTYFPAKSTSALLILVYHDKSEKDTRIIQLFIQFFIYSILDRKPTCWKCHEGTKLHFTVMEKTEFSMFLELFLHVIH